MHCLLDWLGWTTGRMARVLTATRSGTVQQRQRTVFSCFLEPLSAEEGVALDHRLRQ
jgi:hypothetical protein